MSYWYEAKKENIRIDEDELHIYLGTDPAYDDCGNIYVTIKRKDIEEVIEEKKKSDEKLLAERCDDCVFGGCKMCDGKGKCSHSHLPRSKGGARF